MGWRSKDIYDSIQTVPLHLRAETFAADAEDFGGVSAVSFGRF